jgi:peptide/nickel transport system permease protein
MILVGIAVIAPIVLPAVAHEQAGDLLKSSQGPSWAHPLGTDPLGRDLLDRLLVGTKPTLVGVAEAVFVALAVGLPIGLMAGYFGGAFDRAVTWWTDLMFSLPVLAITLVVLSVFRQSMLAAMIALGVLASATIARVVRSATLPVRQELYVAAAQVSGLSHPYIVVRHVLPRIRGPIIVIASLWAGAALLAQSGLAYLGLLVPVPAPSWGGMIGDGIQAIVQQPWLIWPPGIAITLTVVALGLVGDAVRDATAENWSATPVRPRKRRLANRQSNVGLDARSAKALIPSDQLLTVSGLTVALPTDPTPTKLVEDVSFGIRVGETVGLVGESGCGKTVTSMSLLGLLPANAEIIDGSVSFGGRDLAQLPESELRKVRGKEIGLVSQESMASLNPAYRVGWQLALAIRVHHGLSKRASQARAVDLLRQVHLPEPEVVARRFPHELSGGMAQRVAIARALAGEPRLLIADEPTTALDVTLQAEIVDLLREIQRERDMAMLLVTHDWGVIADVCDRAVVMYAGQIVEQSPLQEIFSHPRHPYTAALLASNPHGATEGRTLPTIPGSVPKPGDWPVGCHFQQRCAFATDGCTTQKIELERVGEGHETRCIHHARLVRQ